MNLRVLGDVDRRLAKLSQPALELLYAALCKDIGDPDFRIMEQVSKRYAMLTPEERDLVRAAITARVEGADDEPADAPDPQLALVDG
jgi:hypothetical protein